MGKKAYRKERSFLLARIEAIEIEDKQKRIHKLRNLDTEKAAEKLLKIIGSG